VDGDLTNGWPRYAPATPFVPGVGECHDYHASTSVVELTSADTLEPCRSQRGHREVAYVGRFSGIDADQAEPPAGGSPSRRAAYEQCLPAVNEYLGGDWHGALVEFTLVLPTRESWQAGLRTFHCDLARKLTMFDNAVYPGIVSVKNGLRGSRPLALSCAIQDSRYDSVEITMDIACDRRHNAELAGLYSLPDVPWPGDPTRLAPLAESGCREVVARFLGFADARSWRNKEVRMWWASVNGEGPDERRWRLGDRTVLCFAATHSPARLIVGSMKDVGTGKLQDA
jgi:hypothetical protein